MNKARREKQIIGTGRFAVGRIRSLEQKLMDRAALDRLITASSEAEIRQLMNEAGYEDGPIEAALDQEQGNLLTLIYEMSPDLDVLDLVGESADAHNLKIGLRKRLMSPDERLTSYQHLYRTTGRFPFKELDAAIRSDDVAGYPVWMQTAFAAVHADYAESFDPVRIDVAVDTTFAAHQMAEAKRLKADWLADYFALMFDLKNMETLFRVRRRGIKESQFAQNLLPDGMLKRETWLTLYDAADDVIVSTLAIGPYASLATRIAEELAGTAGGRWSWDVDRVLMRHLRKTKLATSGPDVPLAFLLARQQEIRSIRLVFAAVRNHMGTEAKRSFVRQSFLERE